MSAPKPIASASAAAAAGADAKSAPVAVAVAAEVTARLTTVEYLLEPHTADEFEQTWNIKTRRHRKFKNLVQFKYNPSTHAYDDRSLRIVNECRGLILDEKANWAVVAFPYHRFYNSGEKCAAKIDWAAGGVSVYDKVDGSLMTLYHYADDWHVATSGMPDASGETTGTAKGKTYHILFFEIWKALKYKLPKEKNSCFMFELFSVEAPNQIKPKTDRIVFHGARRLTADASGAALTEWDATAMDGAARSYGWEVVKSFPMKSLAEVVAAANRLNPGISEGFVVCDKHFNRIKVKCPQFVALSHMGDNASSTEGGQLNMLHVIRASESSEFLAYFPQHTDLHARALNQFTALAAAAQNAFNKKYPNAKAEAAQRLKEAKLKEEKAAAAAATAADAKSKAKAAGAPAAVTATAAGSAGTAAAGTGSSADAAAANGSCDGDGDAGESGDAVVEYRPRPKKVIAPPTLEDIITGMNGQCATDSKSYFGALAPKAFSRLLPLFLKYGDRATKETTAAAAAEDTKKGSKSKAGGSKKGGKAAAEEAAFDAMLADVKKGDKKSGAGGGGSGGGKKKKK